jgi:hypothetical protein
MLLSEFNTKWKVKPTLHPVLNYIDFENLFLELTNEQCAEFYKDICNLTYEANANRNHESAFVTNIYGEVFVWSCYGNGNLTVWDSTGGLTIASGCLPVQNEEPLIRAKAVRKYTKRMEEFSSGLIHCSDCDDTIKIHEIAGKYFAGGYCEKCWSGKWKAIEAKENYN